ncbi:hypothetical protein AC249_AIPGENE18244 [Exaiptasia diaphana]|nr:hypothetical protein AC249_AIPGENE18244 [Exaiptasia diaphana]
MLSSKVSHQKLGGVMVKDSVYRLYAVIDALFEAKSLRFNQFNLNIKIFTWASYGSSRLKMQVDFSSSS